ncbi:copper chaperone CopZ [Tepidibacillus infernus]|uniref:Copper chaperone CopZ n=1 Tax=Tepidibacillus decaturensis TaxID=1413211 RepID=A0A135L259_9BACI|nr:MULTISPECIES: copper chaperone CopZ [Tepidibacillus]KXG42953.1 copper resistance protein CopZ [Tepidibacillus decaturensis]GBF10897.1 copper chaperone CopZ [Tepidibacillus sp. HK-1]
MEKVIKVEGMTCNHCKMAVEGALKKLAGVSNAVVSLENKNVTVSFDEGKVTFEQMKEAIEDQGYDVVA